MSRFFSSRFSELKPYIPGVQPSDPTGFTKLNTNESPFAPSEKALAYAAQNVRPANLYCDTDAKQLCALFAQTVGVEADEVIAGNGSDEILNFAFMAFCGEGCPAVFPDITYGFYPVLASLNGIKQVIIPLEDDLSINVDKYMDVSGTLFIANPNAPTGIALPPSEIEKLAAAKPDSVIVVDEAYVDFGAQSCIPLTKKYSNVLVVQTFSKSRSMAGSRLGFAIGNKELINDLNTIKYSTNPYNVNSYTQALGAGTLLDRDYTEKCCAAIIQNREYTVEGLKKLGFELTDSSANFVFAKHPECGGKELLDKLAERKILVRHFGTARIKDYLRITIGSKDQMDVLLDALAEIITDKA
ncbi:MAG: histidinol-phosphate transaminase [Clostridia bacterium]|nr:histidinol-phosphate transaminase [Clostridia bacterium]